MGKGIELHPGMGPEILQYLRRFGELPEKGVVAGQAVASAIGNLYGAGGEPINDIDIFDHGWRGMSRVERYGNTVQYVRPEIGYDSYAHLTEVRLRQTYRVLKAWRKGMLNHVAVETDLLTPQRIISGFDINSTRAAVDLETQQLSWAPDFEFFVRTRQLQISSLQTPWHTAIRYLKKMEELPGVYGDIGLNMEIVSLPWASMEGTFEIGAKGGWHIARRFGDKYHALYEKHQAALAPYFELIEDNGLYQLRPRGKPDPDLLEIADRTQLGMLSLAPRLSFAARLKRSRADQRKSELVAAKGEGYVAEQHALIGDEYVRGQVSEGHIEAVEALFRRHPWISQVMIGLTLDEQLRAKKWLSARAKEQGQWVYGVVETQAVCNDLRSEADLDLLLRKAKAKRAEPLVKEALFPARRRLGIAVQELTTTEALMDEGNAMMHCVGGYGARIRSGACRIVSLRAGRDRRRWSTAEVCVKDGQISIFQHQGQRNRTPHWHNRLALYWALARAARRLPLPLATFGRLVVAHELKGPCYLTHSIGRQRLPGRLYWWWRETAYHRKAVVGGFLAALKPEKDVAETARERKPVVVADTDTDGDDIPF